LGELTVLAPQTPSWNKGALLLSGGEGKERKAFPKTKICHYATVKGDQRFFACFVCMILLEPVGLDSQNVDTL